VFSKQGGMTPEETEANWTVCLLRHSDVVHKYEPFVFFFTELSQTALFLQLKGTIKQGINHYGVLILKGIVNFDRSLFGGEPNLYRKSFPSKA
jgi:hypothetical protein